MSRTEIRIWRAKPSTNLSGVEMSAYLTDAHCHISDLAKISDKIAGLCSSACFPEEWEALSKADSRKLKKTYGFFPALKIGAQPGDITEWESLMPDFARLFNDAAAIGETGIDERFSKNFPVEIQADIFSKHLSLADDFKLPVIIHCVGAWGLLLDIIRKWTGKRKKKFLIHAAKCSAELCSEFVKLGGFFSFGARELNLRRVLVAMPSIPKNRILSESDSAEASEQLAMVESAVGRIAETIGISADEAAALTSDNFNELFCG